MSKALFNKIESVYREIYKHKSFIPLHEPIFTGNEKKYINECIDSTFVSSIGKYVDTFQKEMIRYSGSKYAVATVNGTSALHLALLCCDIGSGDEVLCPDVSFVATAAAVVYSGAAPVFLDVDIKTLGLSSLEVEKFILENTYEKGSNRFNKKTHKRIKACIPMHNIGFPTQIEALQEVCKEYNIIIIEDAAEALGSTVNNKMCGTFGKASIYSFNGNKIITTGGGGMLITDDKNIYNKALHLSTTAKRPHPYLYIHDGIGYNYRMPNLNAALGLAQLEVIDDLIKIKQEQHNHIRDSIDNAEFEIVNSNYGISNNWFVVAKLNNIDTKTFVESMAERGIMARPIWSRISQMKPYSKYMSTMNCASQQVVENYICLPNGVANNEII